LGAHSDAGDAYGLLIDVAELWELFLHHCVREAAVGLSVERGTTSAERTFLLAREADATVGIGKLKPDIIVRDGDTVVAVIDAKYKRLVDFWPDRPAGVDRSDLYQLAAYLSRFDPDGNAKGMLLYPDDPEQSELSTAESAGPWRTENQSRVRFERIPLAEYEAVEQVRVLLGAHDA
jgi:5-methylcytosine-specific restriction enzyme subunit McrC